MREVFISEKLNSQLFQDGYIIIDQTQDNICKEISHIFSQYHSEHTRKGFSTTHFSSDRKYKEEVLAVSKEIFDCYFSHLFNSYEVIFSNLMVKTPDSEAILPVHADWTYIDEKQGPALSIWIPIQDITEENGAFGVIPGSHHLYVEKRGPEIVSPYRVFDYILKEKKGVLLPIRKSQAIIYDLRLLHFSLPNLSENTRVAINITIVPKGSELVHYTMKEDKIYKYEHLDEEFFLNYHAHQIPEGIMPDEILSVEHNIDSDTISSYYLLNEEAAPEDGWLGKLLTLFKH